MKFTFVALFFLSLSSAPVRLPSYARFTGGETPGKGNPGWENIDYSFAQRPQTTPRISYSTLPIQHGRLSSIAETAYESPHPSSSHIGGGGYRVHDVDPIEFAFALPPRHTYTPPKHVPSPIVRAKEREHKNIIAGIHIPRL
jgi:hypothetical protein